MRPLLIVGCGRVGTFWARAALGAEISVAVAVRDRGHVPADLRPHAISLERSPRSARAVLLAVPDQALGALPSSIFGTEAPAVAHAAGALGSEALVALGVAPARAAAAHPLYPFTSAAESPPPHEVTHTLEGAPAAVAALERLFSELGCPTLGLRPGQRALYHLACVLASNHVVTLAALARALGAAATGDAPALRPALDRLMAASVRNLEARPTAADALSGPVHRGDASTLEAHRAALEAARPDLWPLYRELVRATSPLAPPEAQAALRALLSRWALSPGPRPPDP